MVTYVKRLPRMFPSLYQAKVSQCHIRLKLSPIASLGLTLGNSLPRVSWQVRAKSIRTRTNGAWKVLRNTWSKEMDRMDWMGYLDLRIWLDRKMWSISELAPTPRQKKWCDRTLRPLSGCIPWPCFQGSSLDRCSQSNRRQKRASRHRQTEIVQNPLQETDHQQCYMIRSTKKSLSR